MDYQDKWNFVDKAIEEIQNIENVDNSEDTQKLSRVKDKLIRLRDLKSKIEEKELKIHLHHLVLLKERNLYLEKWRVIEQLGHQHNWEDETGILQKIRELLESFGANNNQGQQYSILWYKIFY